VNAVAIATLVPLMLMAVTLGLARVEASLLRDPESPAEAMPDGSDGGHPTGVMSRSAAHQRLEPAPSSGFGSGVPTPAAEDDVPENAERRLLGRIHRTSRQPTAARTLRRGTGRRRDPRR
jgi:hypothetical protein